MEDALDYRILVHQLFYTQHVKIPFYKFFKALKESKIKNYCLKNQKQKKFWKNKKNIIKYYSKNFYYF